ncbi:hypothetical protein VOI54_05480 [Tamlana sp. 2201CG12-4]|uniref:hypothetical protein n=1 Tax=Tamlana sp. 2201CG12-4 TaxID=3112582 RepID=UPI002DB88B45|nr:hypothetical protein [Tamlana sp. 2201CG12-4]MEC3906458.1 hypothetical protein [Tamlana sp. 2201CG12-4]
MKTSNFFKVAIVLVVLSFNNSCQKDSFTEPNATVREFSYNIPGKIKFRFSQQSGNSNAIRPYTNTLSLFNLDDNTLSFEYAIFSFDNDNKIYANLGFVKQESVTDLKANDSITSITLQANNIVFSDTNLLVSILALNNKDNNHGLNGIYTGELNILKPVADSDPEFIRSLSCTGFIDYQGKFNFFIQDREEIDISRINGNFNSDNLISGNIKKSDDSVFSQLKNVSSIQTQLSDKALTGQFMFTENNEERLLDCKLTRQH